MTGVKVIVEKLGEINRYNQILCLAVDLSSDFSRGENLKQQRNIHSQKMITEAVLMVPSKIPFGLTYHHQQSSADSYGLVLRKCIKKSIYFDHPELFFLDNGICFYGVEVE